MTLPWPGSGTWKVPGSWCSSLGLNSPSPGPSHDAPGQRLIRGWVRVGWGDFGWRELRVGLSLRRGLLEVRTRPHHTMESRVLPVPISPPLLLPPGRPPDFTRTPDPGMAPAPSCSFPGCDILGKPPQQLLSVPWPGPSPLLRGLEAVNLGKHICDLIFQLLCGGRGCDRVQSQGWSLGWKKIPEPPPPTTTFTPGFDPRLH